MQDTTGTRGGRRGRGISSKRGFPLMTDPAHIQCASRYCLDRTQPVSEEPGTFYKCPNRRCGKMYHSGGVNGDSPDCFWRHGPCCGNCMTCGLGRARYPENRPTFCSPECMVCAECQEATPLDDFISCNTCFRVYHTDAYCKKRWLLKKLEEWERGTPEERDDMDMEFDEECCNPGIPSHCHGN